ncbi:MULTISPECIES: enoyl-CoA hydratase [unclassified Herbaspirillum]|uniref:enoyl-CoA hydratase n=1 Tax=unclassified Herbaspirillum TaxID=2624150 RepID=UPI000E2F6F45|nr:MULTISPECIES: enoyl-CoA hydratase [unclassified Herbaspirillum]RFB70867.1 enoyl-CoA hydratase [Herbaspirillum sp. 3R-3a1]TFI09137.1 enoyl-CoA hydratase [Herbaspirillum sp. 3R11]TFI15555.1 enoyl-CoA hydratase [Herbaspirillum sp. 3R-11]TFI25423.1 enoyl-CoA hydratase [Herbaspirillum sp. 3C11]
MNYVCITSEIHGKVGLIRLNRSAQLNALNDELLDELTQVLDIFEADNEIGCIVITGSQKAFAAGADISAMATMSYMSAYKQELITRNWERVTSCRKPVIAAVSGFAVGGGCELAMMCDMIFASDSAKFSQPEVKLGLLPGAGGTQRLPRAIGKAKAMDMCLTGRTMTAAEAEKNGLVARIFPAEELIEETLKVATEIASFSQPVAMMIKESVNRAFESSLREGILFERHVFHSVFATADSSEGIDAFLTKRHPTFKDC